MMLMKNRICMLMCLKGDDGDGNDDSHVCYYCGRITILTMIMMTMSAPPMLMHMIMMMMMMRTIGAMMIGG